LQVLLLREGHQWLSACSQRRVRILVVPLDKLFVVLPVMLPVALLRTLFVRLLLTADDADGSTAFHLAVRTHEQKRNPGKNQQGRKSSGKILHIVCSSLHGNRFEEGRTYDDEVAVLSNEWTYFIIEDRLKTTEYIAGKTLSRGDHMLFEGQRSKRTHIA
jgi:hypothetical protein